MDAAPKKTLRALAAAGLALLVIVACWARAPRVATPSLPPETPPLGPQRVPAFAALPRHFAPPEKSRWGKDAAAPYPTGASAPASE